MFKSAKSVQRTRVENPLMLLCDIGNSSFHFFNTDEESEYKEPCSIFNPSSIKEQVYYICVNSQVLKKLSGLSNWINLEPFIDKTNYYETMGIDRIVACEALQEGIIIDAGSAITVDVVKDSVFQGGFIYPGALAMQKTFTNISSVLDYSFNFELDLDKMPKNSQDAISYGYLKTLYCEVMSHNMEIVLTGGDATKFAKIFPYATIDERLLFNSMKKIMRKADIC